MTWSWYFETDWLYLKNEQIESTDILQTGANSGKLKVNTMAFKWAWSEMDVAI